VIVSIPSNGESRKELKGTLDFNSMLGRHK
jgi:hypothetical protein